MKNKKELTCKGCVTYLYNHTVCLKCKRFIWGDGKRDLYKEDKYSRKIK